MAERVSGRGGEAEGGGGGGGGGAQPGGWLQALRQIAMGFDLIGPTIAGLAIAAAVAHAGNRIGGAIDRTVDNVGEAMIAAGQKLKYPKK